MTTKQADISTDGQLARGKDTHSRAFFTPLTVRVRQGETA